MTSVERFMKLFAGSQKSHTFNVQTDEVRANGKKPGKTRVVHGAAGSAEYQAHLSGERGLGIVPVCADETCSFGLIDIDVYDDPGLLVKVAEDIFAHGLPLIPCASKSGGVQAWLFSEKPVPAALMRMRLGEMAKALGYPKTEIFPKQDGLDEGVGSAINLPYFGDTRRAVSADGDVLTREMFLDIAEGGVVAEDVVPRRSAEWFEEAQPTRIPLARLTDMALRKVAKQGVARHVAGQQFFQQMHDNRFSRIEAEQASDEFVEAINKAESGSSGYSKNKAAQHVKWAWSKEAREPLAQSKASDSESQADTLLSLTEDFEYFKAGISNDGYVRVTSADHREVLPAGNARGPSHEVRHLLTQRYLAKYQRAPNRDALNTAGDTVLAKCGAGSKVDVYVRFARKPDVIYFDLCDEAWRAVEITAAGWRVVGNPPVLFTRPKGVLSVREPERGGSLEAFRPLINCEDDSHWFLLLAFMVGVFLPEGSFAHLCLEGATGNAKTSMAEVLKALLDPSEAPLAQPPKNETNAMVSALNCGLLAYDNMSGCDANISDVLCRFSTGEGWQERTLYENLGMTIAKVKLPVIMNGISNTVMRPDLLNRSIMLKLPKVVKRITVKHLWKRFHEVHPQVLGALFDAVCVGLRNLAVNVEPEDMPRMSDFYSFLAACEPGLPCKPGQILETYRKKLLSADRDLAENDDVALAILDWAKAHIGKPGSTVERTPMALLVELNRLTLMLPKDMLHWPTNPAGMAHRLDRIAPLLQSSGIELRRLKRSGPHRSRWQLTRMGPQGALAFPEK